jgi:hypothetical protein
MDYDKVIENLTYLLDGNRITYRDREFCLSDEHEMCSIGYQYTIDGPKEVLLKEFALDFKGAIALLALAEKK